MTAEVADLLIEQLTTMAEFIWTSKHEGRDNSTTMEAHRLHEGATTPRPPVRGVYWACDSQRNSRKSASPPPPP